jgi:PII-like signaling protein
LLTHNTIIPPFFTTSRTPGNTLISISLETLETGIAIGIFVAIAFAHTIAGSSIARRVQGFHSHAIIMPCLPRSIASRNRLIAISLKTGQARLTIRVLVAITLAHAVRVCAQIILQINYVLFIDAVIPPSFTTSRTPGNTLEFISLETLETGIAIGIFVAIAFAQTIAGSSIARRVQGFHTKHLCCAIIPIFFTLSRTPGNTRISISLETLETGIAIGIMVAIAFAHTIAGSSIARRVQGFYRHAIIPPRFRGSRTPGNRLVSAALKTHQTNSAIGIFVAIAFANAETASALSVGMNVPDVEASSSEFGHFKLWRMQRW